MAMINGTNAGDTLRGTPANDIINGLGGTDALHGLGGDDKIDGGDSTDRLYGGNGNDSLTSGDVNVFGADLLYGEAGNDGLGFGDDDTASGGAGLDDFATNARRSTAATVTDFFDTGEKPFVRDGFDLGGTARKVDSVNGTFTSVQYDRDADGTGYGWQVVCKLMGVRANEVGIVADQGDAVITHF